ncbi:ABC transporter permease subunit [Pseudalkalibacillus hwajinpoensis]|uniref:ABC transporter permease subunit n=1 Tax=Guptibacillus hwajinpoensis TaxID=208199 RepID=A0A4U1MLD1_9BACL|nr:ABC transporter permease subunit [Pseudalkalibacillus hwajinpoensis]TKD72289.1 ABC transporter permease subunit [Pseudalkalibacillus hwajinpoensis]
MGTNIISNQKFLLGSSVLIILFFSSMGYYFIAGDAIPEVDLLYNEKQELLSPPYSPVEHPPFGTDNFSRDLFFVILTGAKYTLGGALIIALVRLLVSLLIGLVIRIYLGKLKKIIVWSVEAFNYFPAVLLSYFLLSWFLLFEFHFTQSFSLTFNERVIISLVVLIIVSLPTTTVLIINETDRILTFEFIEGVRSLGGRRFHILIKHIIPHLKPQLFVVFIREYIQTLLLMAHLGILNVFIGGSVPKADHFQISRFVSLSNEWSGLIGNWWQFIWTGYPWITFLPVFFFTVSILSAKLALRGVEENMLSVKSSSDSKRDTDIKSIESGSPFHLLKQNESSETEGR